MLQQWVNRPIDYRILEYETRLYSHSGVISSNSHYVIIHTEGVLHCLVVSSVYFTLPDLAFNRTSGERRVASSLQLVKMQDMS